MHQPSATTLAIICALMTASAQIALKIGVSTPALVRVLSSGSPFDFIVRALVSPPVLFGLLLYAIGAVLWLLVLARAEVSYAFPLVSLGFVFTGIYAYFALHEVFTAQRLIGTALIVCGVILVSRS